ncbi:acetyltransferase [Fimbriimonas ginsengisoli Gsoil 348]|uniref:Acetyltransferase n=1 Tax=Fimbriimonas ginsengisoli Gsoil 348 TaxID=661478 RepID=A0A068NMQ4_FIMGI|nr:acetyltransferase [Fimbriimonas ginsengisoli Gsoil 348]
MDAAIAEQVAFFAKMGQEFEWTVYGTDGPADLKERLARHGFEIGPREAVMIYDLEDGLAPFSQVDCRVVRVATTDQVEEFRGVAEAVFEKDYSRTCGELAAGLGSTNHLGYIAYDGDQPVGIGRLYTMPDSRFGGLYGGGTLASHRGRGFYRALVATRAQDAEKFGARYLRVDALPTSRPILERMGFTHLTDTWPCTHG